MVSPSADHVILGRGWPLAMHRRDTGWPGLMVWSSKREVITGGSAGMKLNYCCIS